MSENTHAETETREPQFPYQGGEIRSDLVGDTYVCCFYYAPYGPEDHNPEYVGRGPNSEAAVRACLAIVDGRDKDGLRRNIPVS